MQVYIASDRELPLDGFGIPVRATGARPAWKRQEMGFTEFVELFDGCACCLLADDPTDIDFDSRGSLALALRLCVDAGCRIELLAEWGEDHRTPIRMADLVPEDLARPTPTFEESFENGPLLFTVRSSRETG